MIGDLRIQFKSIENKQNFTFHCTKQTDRVYFEEYDREFGVKTGRDVCMCTEAQQNKIR